LLITLKICEPYLEKVRKAIKNKLALPTISLLPHISRVRLKLKGSFLDYIITLLICG